MNARAEAAATPTLSEPRDPGRALAHAARGGAARAVEETRGGLALVFGSLPGAPEGAAGGAARLLAAAGFPSPDGARAAAQALQAAVSECLENGEPARSEAIARLGERAAAGWRILPLAAVGRIHGALAVGLPAPPDTSLEDRLGKLAADLALVFDHAQLSRELAALRDRLCAAESATEEKGEEILKLSEALFAQDIELLRSSEKLGKIEKLKNDFIEKMSRELRTPLNGIIEAIISVLTGEDDSLSDSSKAILRSALDDGTAFLRTLQNILDLWRIKQGELPVEIQDVNFREVVEEAIFSVQDAIGTRPLVVEQHLEEPLPKIRTDLTKVTQILFLLLDNAVKFTPRGQIEISARVEDERLYCEVRDTGIGICPDDQQFLFDEFFQVDDGGSEKSRGAGLGLALVRDLIVLLEGGIAVNSEVGRGSTVCFDIPVGVVP